MMLQPHLPKLLLVICLFSFLFMLIIPCFMIQGRPLKGCGGPSSGFPKDSYDFLSAASTLSSAMLSYRVSSVELREQSRIGSRKPWYSGP